jgi:hypothetical protein
MKRASSAWPNLIGVVIMKRARAQRQELPAAFVWLRCRAPDGGPAVVLAFGGGGHG